MRLARLNSQIDALKGVLVSEFNVQKGVLEQQIAAQRADLKLKSDELEKELAKVKKQKELLVAEQNGNSVLLNRTNVQHEEKS